MVKMKPPSTGRILGVGSGSGSEGGSGGGGRWLWRWLLVFSILGIVTKFIYSFHSLHRALREAGVLALSPYRASFGRIGGGAMLGGVVVRALTQSW